jgi:uncharacterized membrane-anchored protein YhcB (DUF1043 family)
MYISFVVGVIIGYVLGALNTIPQLNSEIEKLKPVKIADILKKDDVEKKDEVAK